MLLTLPDAWQSLLKLETEKPYFQSILSNLESAYKNETIYPKASDVFRAFALTPPEQVKVVILGQDPYHGPQQANGLAFSVHSGVKIPPSLRNIIKAIELEDISLSLSTYTGDLSEWASQGVLLLNSILTVKEGQPASHEPLGWAQFTDAVLRVLDAHFNQLVFILWGAHAQKKAAFIDTTKHLVLTSVHPSPLSASRGFFEAKHFSKTNSYLVSVGKTPIAW